MQTHIRQALDEKFTGQIHISFLNNKKETIFVHEGSVRQVYIRNHRVPDLNWNHPLIRFGRGTLKMIPMPTRAMMFQKIALEEISRTPSQPAYTNQLRTMLDLTEHNSSPTLFHIQWEQAQGFMLASGKGMPIRHTVMLTPAGAVEGSEALSQMTGWPEAECKVTVRRGDIKNQAWLEIHLNILLERHCQAILKQYGQLTGGVVVRSILQNLMMLATRKGWNITVQGQHLSDASIFASAAEAGMAYREVISTIKTLMIPVIGSALTQNLIHQAKFSVRDVYRTMEDVFGLLEVAE